MFRSIRWMLALAVVAAAIAAAPEPALADGPSCTENYRDCIVESGLLDSPLEELADIECAAEYVGCVGRKLKFW